MTKDKLVNRTEIVVRFSEVDSMGIVWHGHYVKFFEDGREAFGKEHNLGYMDIYGNGYFAPVVKVDCNFKRYVKYGDTVVVESEFVNTKAAKIVFKFRIFNKSNQELVAEGESIQVFTSPDGELILTNPQFYEEWKMEKGMLEE